VIFAGRRSRLGNNEPFRVLSDFERRDENAISSLTARGASNKAVVGCSSSESEDHGFIDSRGLRALSATLEHAQQCFVGVFERCAETAEALAFFHPWLQGVNDLGCKMPQAEPPGAAESAASTASTATAPSRPHRVMQNGGVAKKPLNNDQRIEVERQNTLELRLYTAANAMLDAQLRVARGEW
jgi:hypothetical protein